MNFNEYQYKAQQTATYPQETTAQALTYLSLGLNGEAGEVADKIKKWFRGDYDLTPEIRHEIVKECGDVLWYISEIARSLNFTLEELAEINIQKLFDRKDRGQLHGDGDNR